MKLYHDIPFLRNTAVALGCFDGVHLGHQAVIHATDDVALSKTVFSFSDDASYKEGASHLATFEDKCCMLEAMGVEHLIVPPFVSVKAYSPERFFREILIGQLGARRVACGENYHFGQYAAGTAETMQALCREHQIDCRVVAPVVYRDEIISSSRIRRALADGAVDEAGAMLGRLFGYCFEVVHGRQLGRTLGTPTLNQYFPAHFLIPRYGVYASVTEWNGQCYHSVTNIGVKPTVGSPMPLSETWVPDFSGDLYGQSVRVNLVKYMRDECKFDSIEQLKQAILQDGANSKRLTAAYMRNGGEQFGV